jgi:hypothetical protein
VRWEGTVAKWEEFGKAERWEGAVVKWEEFGKAERWEGTVAKWEEFGKALWAGWDRQQRDTGMEDGVGWGEGGGDMRRKEGVTAVEHHSTHLAVVPDTPCHQVGTADNEQRMVLCQQVAAS